MAEGDPVVSQVFGYTATPLALLFYISPVFLLNEAHKTRNLSKVPFLMLFINYTCTFFWIIYGIGKESGPIGLCNVAAQLFNSLWIIWFLIILFNKNLLLQVIFISAVAVSILLTALLCLFISVNVTKYKYSSALDLFGYIAAVLSVLMYAGPGQKIVIILNNN